MVPAVRRCPDFQDYRLLPEFPKVREFLVYQLTLGLPEVLVLQVDRLDQSIRLNQQDQRVRSLQQYLAVHPALDFPEDPVVTQEDLEVLLLLDLQKIL